MKVGFTGTREGMSQSQRDQFMAVISWLSHRGALEFHHGGAEGADTEAAEIVDGGARIVVHKPKRMNADELLARNRVIVAEAEVLVAAPETDTEQQRSGTWATVRYARQKGIPVVMLTRGTKQRPIDEGRRR